MSQDSETAKSLQEKTLKGRLQKITQAEAGGYLSLRNESYFHSFLPRRKVWEMVTVPGEFLVRQATLEENEYRKSDVFIICVMGPRPKEIEIKYTAARGLYYVRELCFDTPSGTLLPPPGLIDYHLRMRITSKQRILPEGTTAIAYMGVLRTGMLAKKAAAIKVYTDYKSQAQHEQLYKLALLLKSLHHKNIVPFLGVALNKCPERVPLPFSPLLPQPMLLTEFCSGGSLLRVVSKMPGPTVGKRELFSFDIVHGLKYLEDRMIIHRDIGARNCFMDSKERVKIGDFANAVFGVKIKERLGRAPFRYLAPEVYQMGIYSCKSDIWSFGIIFHNGRTPYDHLEEPGKVRALLSSGGRLECSSSKYPSYLWKITQDCWKADPDDRPECQSIIDQMKEKVREDRGRFESLYKSLLPF